MSIYDWLMNTMTDITIIVNEIDYDQLIRQLDVHTTAWQSLF